MKATSPPVALSIAGSDSGGGAGIQADLRSFQSLGVYGTAALTAVTAQNTQGVFSIEAVSPRMLSEQIEAVLRDFPIQSAKTGMLYSKEHIEAVLKIWKKLNKKIPLVIDPVLVSGNGRSLTKSSSDFLIPLKELIGLSALSTPNLPEMEAILDIPAIQSVPDMQAACRRFYDAFATSVLLKGGHMPDADNTETTHIVDCFFDGRAMELIRYPRIETRHTHGTGCTLSAAITACLARGENLKAAVGKARGYLQEALLSAPGLGRGNGPLGWPGLV